MTAAVSADTIRDAIRRVTAALELKEPELSALDAAIGDGDMGISVAKGCRAIRETLADGDDIGRLFQEASLTFSESAGATIGALVGIALSRAGRVAKGKTELTMADLAAMLEAAETGIRERGKAKVGKKTMLDALAPAREALAGAIADGLDAAATARRVAKAAEDGAASTTGMVAAFGRGRWIGEKSVGHRDAGASAIAIAFDSL